MRPSSLYGHAVQLLDLIRSTDLPADVVVSKFFAGRRYLGSSDRRFIADCVFDIVRHHALVAAIAAEADGWTHSGQGLAAMPSVVLLATYLVHVRAEPPVPLAPHLADLWRMESLEPAVEVFLGKLGHLSLSEEVRTDPVRRLSVQHSLPAMVVEEWLHRFGADEAEELCRAMNVPAPVSARVNTLRCTRQECLDALHAEGVEAHASELTDVGVILPKRVNARALKSFRSGMFELQDEASQVVSLLLGPAPGENIVDACAGAGGKSLHCAALMGGRGAIVAIDTEVRRLNNLRERAARAGITMISSLHARHDRDAIEKWSGRADRVLIDAPCSGVGTFRRSPWAKLKFSPEAVAAVSRTQQSVLADYARLVKPGGTLLYATCTLLRRENEDVVAEFLATHADFAPASGVHVPGAAGLSTDADGCLMLLPHRTGTDGFFMCLLVKREV